MQTMNLGDLAPTMKRITVIDAMRGIALIGICLTHALQHFGTFFSVLICLGYTIVQIQASHYWLKKYRFGPVEWLWRSATYLKWQPLRKSLLAE